MAAPGRLDEFRTREWLRAALEISPDAFALHHVVRDTGGCFRDLQHEAHEQKRADAQSFAARVLDTIADGALVLDPQFRVRAANRSFHRLYHLTPTSTHGKNLFDLGIGGENRERLRHFLERAGPQTHEELPLDHVCPVTGRRTFIHTAWRIELTHFTLLVTRESTAGVVTELDAGFQSDLAATECAVVVTRRDGTIAFANRGLHHLFGHEPGELTGHPIDALIPSLRRQEGAVQGRGLAATHKDGTPLAVDVALNWVTVGTERLAVCLVKDAKRRLQTTDRVREYQEKLRRMTFDAAVAAEQERRRIAVELHDRIGQALAVARIKLKAIDGPIPPRVRTAIDETLRLVEQSAADTRTLSFELSPPVLYDLGLDAALSWLHDDLERRYAMEITLESNAPPYVLDDVTASVMFRTVRELLMNVLKHAGATAACVGVRREGDQLVVIVEDRGEGFDLDHVEGGGFGLFSVREQLSRIGAELEVVSAPGRGTRVCVRLTLGEPREDQDSAPTSSPATRWALRSSPRKSVSR